MGDADGDLFVLPAPRWEGSRLLLPYRSRGADGDTVVFTEVVDFGEPIDVPTTSVVVQLLHAAAGLSYWKARPGPVVFDHDVDPRVPEFLATLTAHGMAEWAYVNDRAGDLHPPITAPRTRPAVEPPGADTAVGAGRRALVPLGGGKDSVVTVDLLQREGFAVHCLAVGDHPTIRACATAAGVGLTVVGRTLDPGLAAFTRRTGLNGHVPVTAINSLVALTYALGTGRGDVVMSNEASADEATLESNGLVVNHQWSKSTAFERLLQPLLPASIGYLSLLRPLQEIAIARIFAGLERFHTVAISCNHVYRRDPAHRAPSWCLTCAKCAFVGLVVSPFLTPERRRAVFGGDVLASVAVRDHLAALVGLVGDKPLECVGEVLESRAALLLLHRSGEPLPDHVATVARRLVDDGLMPRDDEVEALFTVGRAAARLPERYRAALGPVERLAATPVVAGSTASATPSAP